MNLIERPEVVGRLRDAVAAHALTIVSAPLGAGKTSALSLAFRDAAGFARLEVEPWHRGAFVAALVATVRQVRQDFGRLTLGALAAGAPTHHLGCTFALELRHVDAPLAIALDNAQVLYDDADFGEFVRAALAELPAPVRLLLVGRGLPDFQLVEAIARRRVTIVRNDALRFRAAEIGAFARSIGRELDDNEITAIEESTAGWPAAIVLALTAHSDGLPALRSLDAAAAYLEAALLPTLEPEVVGFLEATSVFETVDLGILERSPVFHDARAALARLQRGGALVSEFRDADRYRVHPILRDLALRRLAARGALSAAHAAAVDVYERHTRCPRHCTMWSRLATRA